MPARVVFLGDRNRELLYAPADRHATWRTVHFVSFLTFDPAMFHGLASGTDSNMLWGLSMYWVTGGSLLFLLIYRILAPLEAKKAVRMSSSRAHCATKDRTPGKNPRPFDRLGEITLYR